MMRLPRLGETSQLFSRLSTHETTIELSDGSSCSVTYRRFGAHSHRFLYKAPLEEAVWYPEVLANVAPTIEQKAAELAPKAFAQAMADEQRLMRCKTVPKGSVVPPGEPQMKAKAADVVAGCYAVCMRYSTGKLSAIGPASSTVEPAVAALHDDTFASIQLFGEQRLVIGICCRYQRRWVEPRLLPFSREIVAQEMDCEAAA